MSIASYVAPKPIDRPLTFSRSILLRFIPSGADWDVERRRGIHNNLSLIIPSNFEAHIPLQSSMNIVMYTCRTSLQASCKCCHLTVLYLQNIIISLEVVSLRSSALNPLFRNTPCANRVQVTQSQGLSRTNIKVDSPQLTFTSSYILPRHDPCHFTS